MTDRAPSQPRSPIAVQQTFADITPEYAAFLEKYKPKKTTDDCYTPPNVYEAVKDWVFRRYALDPDTPIVRPFWPGASYETCPYPENCVVLDNPPFSIVAKVAGWYRHRGIRFFLFAPHLSNLGICAGTGCCHVFAPVEIRYENGAEIPTSFVTNLDPGLVVETAPDLMEAVSDADAKNRDTAKGDRNLPHYEYPPEVVTSALLGKLAKYGQSLRIRKGECAFIRVMDAQKAEGKHIFGGGLLLSPAAAADAAAAAAEVAAAACTRTWALSARERAMSESLGSEEAAK